MDRIHFAKGHGTGNDFVILPDPQGQLPLTPHVVAQMCDRRRGLGGDGVLRVVRSANHPEARARAGEAEWFMDYWNSDGSLAEMCGNGVRVFARYLSLAGLATSPRMVVLTRSGPVVVEVGEDLIAVDMPVPVVYGSSTATVAGAPVTGTVATCGNPNLVCPVTELATLDLTHRPVVDPADFPHDANVEFVVPTAPVGGADLGVVMRVSERGAGETQSCGSGACAVAAVALSEAGREAGTVAVAVPGGRLTVRIEPGRCVLTGPAVIVAEGDLLAGSLAGDS